jgi:hypothetical protein
MIATQGSHLNEGTGPVCMPRTARRYCLSLIGFAALANYAVLLS